MPYLTGLGEPVNPVPAKPETTKVNGTQQPMSDEEIRDRLMRGEPCFLVIFRQGSCYLPGPGYPGRDTPDPHVRYHFLLMQEGTVSFCGPVTDNTDARWIAVFPTKDRQRVIDFVEEDPDVRSKRLTYEIHPVAGLKPEPPA